MIVSITDSKSRYYNDFTAYNYTINTSVPVFGEDKHSAVIQSTGPNAMKMSEESCRLLREAWRQYHSIIGHSFDPRVSAAQTEEAQIDPIAGIDLRETDRD